MILHCICIYLLLECIYKAFYVLFFGSKYKINLVILWATKYYFLIYTYVDTYIARKGLGTSSVFFLSHAFYLEASFIL